MQNDVLELVAYQPLPVVRQTIEIIQSGFVLAIDGSSGSVLGRLLELIPAQTDLGPVRRPIDVPNAKQVIHVGVTRGPSEKWTAQQLRSATPFGLGPQFIVLDRDDKYGAEFDRVAKGVGAQVIRTAVEVPLTNATMERYVGSACDDGTVSRKRKAGGARSRHSPG